MRTAPQELGERFDQAFALARRLHSSQSRKATAVPYISHLMAVASLVIEDGGDEDEAIAALLHDAVEDQGGAATLEEIRTLFGDRVAAIVDACSEADRVPKPPWRERKDAYIAHLASGETPDGAVRVALADKLHNTRSMLFDLRAGHDVFGRFNATREETIWFYETLANTFATRTDSPMVAELRLVVEELKAYPPP